MNEQPKLRLDRKRTLTLSKTKQKAKNVSKIKKIRKTPSQLRMNILDAALCKSSKAWRAHWPLSVGIEKQIYKLISDGQMSASKRVVQALLRKHCNNPNYLRNTIVGPRYDLNDAAKGEVVTAEAEYAKLHLLKVNSK